MKYFDRKQTEHCFNKFIESEENINHHFSAYLMSLPHFALDFPSWTEYLFRRNHKFKSEIKKILKLNVMVKQKKFRGGKVEKSHSKRLL